MSTAGEVIFHKCVKLFVLTKLNNFQAFRAQVRRHQRLQAEAEEQVRSGKKFPLNASNFVGRKTVLF